MGLFGKKSGFKNTHSGKVAEHIKRNKMIYLMLLISYFGGGLAGIIRAISLPESELLSMKDHINSFFASIAMQSLNQGDIFSNTIWSNIKIFSLLFIFAFHQLVMSIEYIVVAIKGFGMFFTAAFIIRIFGWKGVLFSLISLLPQIVILLPAFMVFIVIYMNLAKERKDSRVSSVWRKFFIISGVFTAITIAISIVEAIVVPVFLKSISMLFVG